MLIKLYQLFVSSWRDIETYFLLFDQTRDSGHELLARLSIWADWGGSRHRFFGNIRHIRLVVHEFLEHIVTILFLLIALRLLEGHSCRYTSRFILRSTWLVSLKRYVVALPNRLFCVEHRKISLSDGRVRSCLISSLRVHREHVVQLQVSGRVCISVSSCCVTLSSVRSWDTWMSAEGLRDGFDCPQVRCRVLRWCWLMVALCVTDTLVISSYAFL